MILNLTQHTSTKEQREDGVVDLTDKDFVELKNLLDFSMLPDSLEVIERAELIARMAKNKGAEAAMIGGALWLMAPLSEALAMRGIKPLFSYSERDVVSEEDVNGVVKKVTRFKHKGFVLAIN